MSYLEKLKEICSKMTEVATDKAQIDRCAELSVTIDSLEKEQTDLLKNYDEMKASYKDAVIHNSYSKQPPKTIEAQTGAQTVSFESVLKEFMANNNNK